MTPTPLLARLRECAPRITASRFLLAHPGSHIQYYDDTPVKNPAKALSVRTFDPVQARRKQRERCAVGFSLQPFGERRAKDELLCLRTLGVDVDLVAPPARATLSPEAIDGRKEQYLRAVLAPFPLRPHWLIETRHGFHLLFRVQPVREPKAVEEAGGINRGLVEALRGDMNAVLVTQLLRVPGTLQFKIPDQPFLCRLLLDNAATIPPYPLSTVRDTLARVHPAPLGADGAPPPRWRQGLAGAAEGARNVTAASLVGRVLHSLPEDLWETAAWGGLKEWNTRNASPLPERELRSVYESITRREAAGRQAPAQSAPEPHSAGVDTSGSQPTTPPVSSRTPSPNPDAEH